MDPQSGTPKTLCPSDPLLELKPRVEAEAGTWRWGRGSSEDSLGRGHPPGTSQGTAAESGWEAVGPGSGLQPPWGDALSPKGKQGTKSFVSKSLLGDARASSDWELLTRRKHLQDLI